MSGQNMESLGACSCEGIVPLPAGAPCPVLVPDRSSYESWTSQSSSFSFTSTHKLRQHKIVVVRSGSLVRVPQRGGFEHLHNDVGESPFLCPLGKPEGIGITASEHNLGRHGCTTGIEEWPWRTYGEVAINAEARHCGTGTAHHLPSTLGQPGQDRESIRGF